MFEDVCCFTGHRYLPADRLGEIKKRLEAESEACIRQGVILFETGGALGFDTMAATRSAPAPHIVPIKTAGRTGSRG